MAKLFFRYGTMNSGKTALLLQAAHNYEEQDMRTFIMKPSIDTKGEDHLVSRIGLKRKVDHLIKSDENIYNYIKNLNDNDIRCIFVDEAQFLTRNQVDELMQIVVMLNIPVICYGLRTDFRGNGFVGSTRLLEIAHTIEEMKTVCKCGKKAMFNLRKVNGKYTFEGEQVAIDGKSDITYEIFCPNCYYDKMLKYKKFKETLK